MVYERQLSEGCPMQSKTVAVAAAISFPATVEYMTVRQWWETHEPVALEILEDPDETFAADAERLINHCEQWGERVLWLPQGNGAAIPLFSERTLADFYPANP
jgi:hypothetical protein